MRFEEGKITELGSVCVLSPKDLRVGQIVEIDGVLLRLDHQIDEKLFFVVVTGKDLWLWKIQKNQWKIVGMIMAATVVCWILSFYFHLWK